MMVVCPLPALYQESICRGVVLLLHGFAVLRGVPEHTRQGRATPTARNAYPRRACCASPSVVRRR
jgi:hypothetical protein